MTHALPGHDEALEAILGRVAALPPCRCRLEEAAGRVLRADLRADRDQPPFDRAAMDGFAVRGDLVQPGRRFNVAGAVAAGAPGLRQPQGADQILRVATGSALPAGADAVVPLEQARVERAEGVETVCFAGPAVVQRGQNVHRHRSDARAGDVVLAAGTVLGPHHIGIAATIGATALEVSAPPRVTLITTGDEVRPPETATADLAPEHVRNSNGPMLAAWCAALGAPLQRRVHQPAEPGQTLDAVRSALAESGLVRTAGGVSVGERDLLPWAWRRLGVDLVVHGVAIQPGKPVLAAAGAGCVVLGLPGNPVSVLATAHLFLWPVLRRMLGLSAALPWRRVALVGAGERVLEGSGSQ